MAITQNHVQGPPRPAISAPPGIADLSLSSTAVTVEPHPGVQRHLERQIARAMLPQGLDFNQAVAYLDHVEPNATLLRIRHNAAATLAQAHKRASREWMETPEGVENRLCEQPFFIRDTYRQKIAWLRANREPRHVSAFFMGTVKKSLLRLEAVRTQQCVREGFASELAVYYRARWTHLAEFTKHEAINAGHTIAARIAEMFETECGTASPESMTDKEIQSLFWHLVREVLALRVTPPFCASPTRIGGGVSCGAYAVNGVKTNFVPSV